MQPRHLTPDVSDEDRGTSPAGSNRSAANRRRSTRACDQCRRTKSKCERSELENICRACAAMGVSCTYAGPSHKRGPPKGYILALERRLHQVEALLGTIISSDDPRARGLVNDLTRDQLAAHIVRRVKIGPFGPRGRLQQPFGSTKEDFLAAIMAGSGDDSPGRYGEENYALVSPDRDWQDRLHTLLSTTRPTNTTTSTLPYTSASAPYTLPSFRQLSSPAPQQSHLLQHTIPVAYTTKLEGGSPVGGQAMLSPVHPSYASHSPAPYHTQSQAQSQPQTQSSRMSWDGFNGYSRLDPTEDTEPKGRYELAPGESYTAQNSSMPRVGGAAESATSVPFSSAVYSRADGSYSDAQRWYYTSQQAVG